MMTISVEPHIKICVDRIPESELRLIMAQMLQRLSMLDGMDMLRSNFPLVMSVYEPPGRFNP